MEADGTTKAKALVRRLKRVGATENFLAADDTDAVPRLDFVRGGILDLDKFLDVPSGANPFRSKFEKALEEAAAADQTGGALVAVFGTGYPISQRTGVARPTGFEGVDNIHMKSGQLEHDPRSRPLHRERTEPGWWSDFPAAVRSARLLYEVPQPDVPDRGRRQSDDHRHQPTRRYPNGRASRDHADAASSARSRDSTCAGHNRRAPAEWRSVQRRRTGRHLRCIHSGGSSSEGVRVR